MIGGFVSALFVLFWIPVPPANEQVITYMIGQLSGFTGGVVAYHYATNRQSEKAADNTGEAFKAITATAQAGVKTDDSALQSGDTVTVKKEE